MIQHKDIVDDQRHPPKGFEGASNETVQVKNSNGVLEWRPLGPMGAIPGAPGDSVANVIVCQKNPGSLQFSDPIAAMASITGSSLTNPYVLEVGPGVYNLSAPLVLKEGVFVKAMGNGAVIFQPSNPVNDIIQINASGCRLQGTTLRGATGIGAAAIRVTAAITPAILDFVTIENCSEQVVVATTGSPAELVLRNLRFLSGPTTRKFIRILAGAQPAVVRVYTTFMSEFDGSVFEDAIQLAGVGSRIDLNTVLVRSSTGVGNGLRASDGAEIVCQSGAEFEGFDKNFFIENIGAAPTLRIASLTLRNGVDKDLEVDHPGTIGSVSANATLSKVLVVDAAPLKLVLMTSSSVEEAGQLVRGDLVQGNEFSQKINLSKLSRGSATMGLFSGGGLADGGGLNVNVGAGNGFLLDSGGQFVKEIFWLSDSITLLPQTATYIYVNSSGILSSGNTLPNSRENIVLGMVATLASSVHFIQDTAVDLKQIGNYVEEFNRRALGVIYESGSLVAEGGTARTLNVGAGKFWFGTIPFAPSGGSPITFAQFFRQAISGFNIVTGLTQVDNANYDTGTGVLIPLSATKFAKHALYITGEGGSEKYFLVTSQAQYDTLIAAEGANIPTPPNTFVDAVSLIATVIVQQGQANIIEISDTRPVIGFKAPGVSASADHGNLLGLTDDDHPQYLRTDGGRTMTGNQNMGGNNITNVGLVDGVDVSNHAARHLPNGADPLTIGTPANLGTVNDPGNSNDLSRGNHSHAHGNLPGGASHAAATTSVNGYMSAADKVRVDAIETLADGRITLQKGAANGLTPLGVDQKVPSIYLPSFVDDVLEFADLASFPVTGETGKIFVALDSNKTYRWSGSSYIEISPSPGTTDALAEGVSNLYFTVARVLATVLTGLNVSLTGAITASDTILQAFGRIQNSLNNILNIVLTGYVIGANTAIAATDTILQAFGKLQGQISANVTEIGLRALAARLINTGYGLTGGGDLTADRTLVVGLTGTTVAATGAFTVTSATDALVTTMTQTPGAGTYLALASCSVQLANGATSQVVMSLYANAAQVSGTERSIRNNANALMDGGLTTVAMITVTAGQAIEMRARQVNGNQTINQRTLTLVRIA